MITMVTLRFPNGDKFHLKVWSAYLPPDQKIWSMPFENFLFNIHLRSRFIVMLATEIGSDDH